MNKYSDMTRPTSSQVYSSHRVAVKESATTRLTLSSLSELTLEENKKVSCKSESLNSLGKSQRLSSAYSNHPSFKLPTQSDFNILLKKLDRITSNKHLNLSRAILTEGETCDFTVEKRSVLYCKVFSRNKPIPMRVTLNNNRGKLKVFVSSKSAEPSELNNSEKFRDNIFAYYEVGENFKGENIFIGVTGTEHCNVAILVKFGNEKKVPLGLNAKRVSEVEFDPADWSPKQRRGQTRPSTAVHKNFLRKNMEIIPLNSPFRENKYIEWNQRRAIAKKRKENLLKQKKERFLAIVKNKEQQRQLEEQKMEQLTQLAMLNARRKIWMVFIYTAKFIENGRSSLKAEKLNRINHLQKTSNIRKLQKAYNSYNPFSTTELAILARATALLKLYRFSAFPIEKEKLLGNTFLMTREIAYFIRLPYYFASFRVKVIQIQRVWRMHVATSKEQWQNLIKFWNRTLGTVIATANKALPKGKKGETIDVNTYVTIKTSLRNKMLTEFYLRQKEKYREKLRNGLRGIPFKCLPSEAKMIRMIHAATSSNT